MIIDNCWMYQGECVAEAPPGYYGFIYKVTDDQGKIYIGKKSFEHSKKVRISKKIRKLTRTRKRISRTKVDSKWLSYWGSSKQLLEYLDKVPDRRDFCRREIIKLCKDKASLSYWEIVTLIENRVLFRDDCWNGNIGGHYFKGKIHE